jgi:hypothetical protein
MQGKTPEIIMLKILGVNVRNLVARAITTLNKIKLHEIHMSQEATLTARPIIKITIN